MGLNKVEFFLIFNLMLPINISIFFLLNPIILKILFINGPDKNLYSVFKIIL